MMRFTHSIITASVGRIIVTAVRQWATVYHTWVERWLLLHDGRNKRESQRHRVYSQLELEECLQAAQSMRSATNIIIKPYKPVRFHTPSVPIGRPLRSRRSGHPESRCQRHPLPPVTRGDYRHVINAGHLTYLSSRDSHRQAHVCSLQSWSIVGACTSTQMVTIAAVRLLFLRAPSPVTPTTGLNSVPVGEAAIRAAAHSS